MYSVSTSNNSSLLLRAAPDPPISLSQETIIIITVSAAIAAAIILYSIYRAIVSHISSVNAPPLPPVQPLAHHRTQRARMHAEVHPDTSYLSAPSTFPSLSSSQGSKASLLDSEVGEDQKDSSLSFPSPISTVSTQFTPRSSHRTEDGSPSRARSVSSIGTSASRRTRHNTIYGMPHGRFSHVQIVVPAPLASGSLQFASPDGRYNHPEPPPARRARTLSFADQWVTVSAAHEPDFSDILVHLPSLPRQPTT